MNVLIALAVSLLAALGIWVWDVMHAFAVADPWAQLPAALRVTFQHPQLRPIGLKALLVGIVAGGGLLWLLDLLMPANRRPRVVAGVEVIAGKALRRRTLEKSKRAPIEVAGVPVPRAIEAQHFLLVGRTGSGKSTTMDEMLGGALARGDRVIVIDPNAHALERFGRKGDEVLNPFDGRCSPWNLFNEVRQNYDVDWLAKSVVPDASNAAAHEWHGYAQQLLAATMRAMLQAGDKDLARLTAALTQVPAATLEAMVAGTVAAGQFTQGAEKALASTRFILAHYLEPLQYLRPEAFSLRDWLERSKGNLYITWREDQLQSLKPLVSSWVDILIASILTTAPDKSSRPLWLFLDELASLEKLTSLEAGLTKGRKHGLRVVAGLQSTAQLEALYGVHRAPTIRGCFGSLLALGCSSADPATAELLAKGLGEQEVEQVTVTKGASGKSTSSQLRKRLAVLPAELTALEPLAGYLKLAGNYPIGKVKLLPGHYPVRIKGFVERT